MDTWRDFYNSAEFSADSSWKTRQRSLQARLCYVNCLDSCRGSRTAHPGGSHDDCLARGTIRKRTVQLNVKAALLCGQLCGSERELLITVHHVLHHHGDWALDQSSEVSSAPRQHSRTRLIVDAMKREPRKRKLMSDDAINDRSSVNRRCRFRFIKHTFLLLRPPINSTRSASASHKQTHRSNHHIQW